MTTDTPTPMPERTFGFRVAHAAFRRDVARLVRAVPRIETAADAAAVAAWFADVAAMLTHHHELEDEIWWPALTDAFDGFAETSAAMVHDHDQLVAALSGAADALAALAAAPPADRPAARRRAEAAAIAVARTTCDHLEAEEAAVFPVLAAVDGEVIADAERRSAKRDSLKMLRFALPWALDDTTPALAGEITRSLPAPLRLLGRRWDHRYRRRFARVLSLSA